MAQLNLTLADILVPDIEDYTPPVGTKITRTVVNKGGLTTQQVTENVLAPFVKMRPVEVTETSTTTNIEYDANIKFNPSAQGVTLTLGSATYAGCKLTLTNTSEYTCVVSGAFGGANNKNIASGKQMNLVWLGNKWAELAGSGSGNGVAFIGTRTQYDTAKLIPEGQDGYIPSGALVIITDEDELLIGEDA